MLFIFSDGDGADAKELARLTGTRDKNPQFVISTGNKLYLYTKTDQADSRRGYRIRYYEGKFQIGYLSYKMDMDLFKVNDHLKILLVNYNILNF